MTPREAEVLLYILDASYVVLVLMQSNIHGDHRYYKFFLDGARIGDATLEPAWTAFRTRVFYSVYDVTTLLTAAPASPATHVLGVELGNGWWNPLPLLF